MDSSRRAGTAHYDGVIRGAPGSVAPGPVVIAICGMGPVNYRLVEPDKPGWRAV